MTGFLEIIGDIFEHVQSFYRSINLGGFNVWQFLIVTFVIGLLVTGIISVFGLGGFSAAGIGSKLSRSGSEHVKSTFYRERSYNRFKKNNEKKSD